jgi:cytochrome c oxidase subunit 1
VFGLATHVREVLTSALDARPYHRVVFPSPTIWPLLTAIAVTGLLIGSIFTPWAIVWGLLPCAAALTVWFWPSKAETRQHLELERRP